jgi:hypothetical protein
VVRGAPSSGTAQDSFTVTVTYRAGDDNGDIECNLDGNPIQSKHVYAAPDNYSGQEFWEFSVRASQPGEHVVGCKSTDTAIKAASFTVTGDLTQTSPTPTGAPTGERVCQLTEVVADPAQKSENIAVDVTWEGKKVGEEQYLYMRDRFS